MGLNWRQWAYNTACVIRTNSFISQWALIFRGYSVTLIGFVNLQPVADNDNAPASD